MNKFVSCLRHVRILNLKKIYCTFEKIEIFRRFFIEVVSEWSGVSERSWLL